MEPVIPWNSILKTSPLMLTAESAGSVNMSFIEDFEREKEGHKRYAPVGSVESEQKRLKQKESSSDLLPDFREQEKVEAVFAEEVKEPKLKRLKQGPSDDGVLPPFRKEEDSIDKKRKPESELESVKRRRTYEKSSEDPFDCSALFAALSKLK